MKNIHSNFEPSMRAQTLKKKAAIKKTFGDSLNWDRLDDFKSSKIWKNVTNKGLRDYESWPKAIEKMTSALVSLQRAFRDQISQLNI